MPEIWAVLKGTMFQSQYTCLKVCDRVGGEASEAGAGGNGTSRILLMSQGGGLGSKWE